MTGALDGCRLARPPRPRQAQLRAWRVRHPKVEASTRSVPLADVSGGELDRLYQATVWQQIPTEVANRCRTARGEGYDQYQRFLAACHINPSRT